jgi:hypothetical protein
MSKSSYAPRFDFLSLIMISVTFVGLWLVWPSSRVSHSVVPRLNYTRITFAPIIGPGSLLDPYRKPLEGSLLRDAVMTASEPLELAERRHLNMLALREPNEIGPGPEASLPEKTLKGRAQESMSTYHARSPEARLVIKGPTDPAVIVNVEGPLAEAELRFPELDATAMKEGPWAVTAFVSLDQKGEAIEVFIEKPCQYEHVNASVLRMLRTASAGVQSTRMAGRVTVNFVGKPIVSVDELSAPVNGN